MQLTPLCLTLACLRVSPDRSQFFRYESISLSCDTRLNSSRWRVKRNTTKAGVRPCSSGWGSASSDSTCKIRNTYQADTGIYWCQSGDMQTSNSINITITDRDVILDSPALPVLAGADVTLRCKAKTKSSKHRFSFYKDDRSISSTSSGEMTIHAVSKSDEGLYKCSVSGGGASLSSRLFVGASPSSPAPRPPSVSILLYLLAVGSPYLLATILLGLIYRDRRRAAQMAAKRRGNDITMETIM